LNNNPIIIDIKEYHHQQTVINHENKRNPILPTSNMKYQNRVLCVLLLFY